MPDSLVVAVLKAFREALLRRESEQMLRMAWAWMAMERSMYAEMVTLASEMEEIRKRGGVVTQAMLLQSDRYKALVNQMDIRIRSLVTKTSIPDIVKEQRAYAGLGSQSATEALKAYGLRVSFQQLPVDALDLYIGMLGDGTPLQRLLLKAYPDAVDGITRGLLDGMAKGKGPVATAKQMSDEMGLGLHRITTIARTEQLRAFRMASTQQYRESGVVTKFKRIAFHDARTCMACLVMDGRIYDTDEEIQVHPQDRCGNVPVVRGAPAPKWQEGAVWFREQPASVQQSMMGQEKWSAWKGGKFKLEDIVQFDHSDTWGDAPRVATMAELGIAQ